MATLKQIFTKMANDVKKYPNIVQLTKTLDEGFKEVADNISGGGGGGSTVSVTQTQTSGNKIGTVTVDGVGTDLYAPKATLSLSGTGNRTLNLNTQVTGSVDVSAVELPVGDTVSVNPIQTTGTIIAEVTVNNVTSQIKAPSASTPVHTYSTTEQVVGKWIDGTTDVYEKLIEFEALPNNTTKSVAHNISNADIVFIHDAFAINSSGNSFALPKASDAFSYQIDISVNRTNVEIWCGSDRSAYNGYVVLRYTKSS